MEENIDVLGVIYKLKIVDSISREELRIGEIDYLKQEILILRDLSKDMRNVTIIHEILHGIFNQLGFFEEEENEHLIQSLSSALYQVFKVNELF